MNALEDMVVQSDLEEEDMFGEDIDRDNDSDYVEPQPEANKMYKPQWAIFIKWANTWCQINVRLFDILQSRPRTQMKGPHSSLIHVGHPAKIIIGK